MLGTYFDPQPYPILPMYPMSFSVWWAPTVNPESAFYSEGSVGKWDPGIGRWNKNSLEGASCKHSPLLKHANSNEAEKQSVAPSFR